MELTAEQEAMIEKMLDSEAAIDFEALCEGICVTEKAEKGQYVFACLTHVLKMKNTTVEQKSAWSAKLMDDYLLYDQGLHEKNELIVFVNQLARTAGENNLKGFIAGFVAKNSVFSGLAAIQFPELYSSQDYRVEAIDAMAFSNNNTVKLVLGDADYYFKNCTETLHNSLHFHRWAEETFAGDEEVLQLLKSVFLKSYPFVVDQKLFRQALDPKYQHPSSGWVLGGVQPDKTLFPAMELSKADFSIIAVIVMLFGMNDLGGDNFDEYGCHDLEQLFDQGDKRDDGYGFNLGFFKNAEVQLVNPLSADTIFRLDNILTAIERNPWVGRPMLGSCHNFCPFPVSTLLESESESESLGILELVYGMPSLADLKAFEIDSDVSDSGWVVLDSDVSDLDSAESDDAGSDNAGSGLSDSESDNSSSSCESYFKLLYTSSTEEKKDERKERKPNPRGRSQELTESQKWSKILPVRLELIRGALSKTNVTMASIASAVSPAWGEEHDDVKSLVVNIRKLGGVVEVLNSLRKTQDRRKVLKLEFLMTAVCGEEIVTWCEDKLYDLIGNTDDRLNGMLNQVRVLIGELVEQYNQVESLVVNDIENTAGCGGDSRKRDVVALPLPLLADVIAAARRGDSKQRFVAVLPPLESLMPGKSVADSSYIKHKPRAQLPSLESLAVKQNQLGVAHLCNTGFWQSKGESGSVEVFRPPSSQHRSKTCK